MLRIVIECDIDEADPVAETTRYAIVTILDTMLPFMVDNVIVRSHFE